MKRLTFFAGSYLWACIVMMFVAWPMALLMMAVGFIFIFPVAGLYESAERHDQRKKVLALQKQLEKYRK